jgi:2-dehydro-3-deoxyphosphogluconate aldolase/(4S)-4-hydroxy-2-oxoglutarate aldolase
MRTKDQILDKLVNPGIIAVVRIGDPGKAFPLVNALLDGGVSAVEITITTPNALKIIKDLRKQVPEDVVIGAGSVTNTKDCEAVIDAGAEFVVSPICNTGLVSLGQRAQIPIMIGAFSPTEAYQAYAAGADFIKIFPAEVLGADFFKAVLAPMPFLKLVPTGGITLENANMFFEVGCIALGVGSSMMPKDLIKCNNWSAISEIARRFVKTALNFKLLHSS